MRRVIAILAVVCVAAAARAVAQVMPTETPASSFIPLSTPAPQIGPAISADNVLAQATEYDNKPVAVTGTARNVRTDATPGGNVLQFDLCGHRCIHVLDANNPTVAEDETETITGTFHRHFQHGRFAQDDIILIIPGGVEDDSQDWRRGFERGYPPTPSPK
jgi:hypothetical protein